MAQGKVFLTGASGFLGSHVAAQLLHAGYSIKASFRTAAKCRAFETAYAGRIVQAVQVPDITAPGAYDGLLDGCDYIIHCASPFTFNVKDVQKELIEPAVQGTTQILNAIGPSSSVKRVVITSSFAAVVNPFQGPRAGYSYTESDWNPMTSEKALENNLFGYQASKTFAERAAWDFLSKRELKSSRISLVTVCPPMIFGPVHPTAGITIENPNESSAQLLNATRGKAPEVTRMPVFVDVRDVAAVHVKALNLDKLPTSERFVVCGGKFTWDAIEETYSQGAFSPQALEPAHEFYSIDSSKAEHLLGIQWTPLEVTVKDTLDSLGIKAKI